MDEVERSEAADEGQYPVEEKLKYPILPVAGGGDDDDDDDDDDGNDDTGEDDDNLSNQNPDSDD